VYLTDQEYVNHYEPQRVTIIPISINFDHQYNVSPLYLPAFRVWGILFRWSACEPTACEVISNGESLRNTKLTGLDSKATRIIDIVSDTQCLVR
jgi:hypothetical protein